MSITKAGGKGWRFFERLTWSKSVDNAGYEVNKMGFYKIMSKLVKSPAPSPKVAPNFKNWVAWWWFRGAGLLALELSGVDGRQAEA